MKFDPPITWTAEDRKRWEKHHQPSLLTSTGKRIRKRGTLNAEAARAKAKVYRARKAGLIRPPAFCPACGGALDPREAEFAHDVVGGVYGGADGLAGRYLHPGCHRRLDKHNPRGGCR